MPVESVDGFAIGNVLAVIDHGDEAVAIGAPHDLEVSIALPGHVGKSLAGPPSQSGLIPVAVVILVEQLRDGATHRCGGKKLFVGGPGHGDKGEVATFGGCGPAMLREENVEILLLSGWVGIRHERIFANVGGTRWIVGMGNAEN